MAGLEDKSMEELEALMRDPAAAEAALRAEDAPPAEPPPTPDPPAPAPVAEATPQEPPPEQEAAELPEEVRLALDAADAEAKRWEKVAGRHAGELDFVKKKVSDLEARLSHVQRTVEPEDGYRPEPTDRPAVEATKADAVTSWAVSQALQTAGAQFMAAHPDTSEMQAQMAEYLQKSGYDATPILASNDPGFVMQEVTRRLEEAHAHVLADKSRKAYDDLKIRKAEQLGKRREAIAKAGVSATGAAPSPPQQHKTYDEMSIGELEKELNRLTR
jgi:hypothetical protein